MSDADARARHLSLGYPLDQLLNRAIPIPGRRVKANAPSGGILLPADDQPGTGNIVIRGRPGAGKSTLAMQLAAACRGETGIMAAYFSLEQSTANIYRKARTFGWDRYLLPVSHVHNPGEPASPEELADVLRRVMTQPPHCPFISDEHQRWVAEWRQDLQKRRREMSTGKLIQDIGIAFAELRDIGKQVGRLNAGEVNELTSLRARLQGILTSTAISAQPTLAHLHEMQKYARYLLLEIDLLLEGKWSDPCILLPVLSPRSLKVSDQQDDRLFWQRYRELEALLSGAKTLRRDVANPPARDLRLVCIDSLNVFGDRPLVREEMHRLFDLFTRYQTIGVFVLEEDNDNCQNPQDNVARDTAEYLADTIIAVDGTNDNGYYMRYLEVVKSRYQHEIYGLHPFKLRVEDDMPPIGDNGHPADRKNRPEQWETNGVVVYPSLHYLVSATDPARNAGNTGTRRGREKHMSVGLPALDEILPNQLMRGNVVAIEGPRDTFKTTMATNFLLDGLRQQEHVLLIRLHEKCRDFRFVRTGTELDPRLCEHRTAAGCKDCQFEPLITDDPPGFVPNEGCKRLHLLAMGNPPAEDGDKYQRREWHYGNGSLVEYAFKSGMLLPEELMDVVLREFRKERSKPVSRVLLDDVGLIGLSYPQLRVGRTSGDLFLPAFVHFMRNQRVDLMLVGTPGELPSTQDAVQRACSLANAVLSTRFVDVFGDQYITITGMGLVSSTSRSSGEQRELVPGIVRVRDVKSKTGFEVNLLKTFSNDPPSMRKRDAGPPPVDVDNEHLAGLVGFDTNRIHRPGLTLNLFCESKIQQRYNDNIGKLLEFAYARPISMQPTTLANIDPPVSNLSQDELDREIRVQSFVSQDSSALHDSIHVLGGKPLSRTVVYTVDEFWEQSMEHSRIGDVFVVQPEVRGADWISPTDPDHGLLARPYYANALLLAYIRKPDEVEPWKPANWTDVLARCSGSSSFYYDRTAPETLNCALLDAIIAGSGLQVRQPLPPTRRMWGRDEQRGRRVRNMLNNLGTENGSGVAAQSVKALLQLLDDGSAIQDSSFFADSDDATAKLGKEGYISSGVYLCWYSQLRELIKRNSSLAGCLGIAPLPGGGFRGDWFLAIANGSVSINLGLQVIDRLCTRKEEYRRFMEGVGMPVDRKFYQENDCDFTAWPGAVNVGADLLYNIHQGAFSRAHIPGYLTFQPLLTRACAKLRELDPDDVEGIAKTLDRFSHRIQFVTGE